MKILMIKDNLLCGGTTSSFLSLLHRLAFESNLEVTVWVKTKDENQLALIPDNIKILDSNILDIAFSREENKFKKAINLLISGQLFYYICYKMIHGDDRKTLISLYQHMSLCDAKAKRKADFKEYDAVITWEELFPCYYLAECIRAKRKIAWIHPDYIQCGFDPKIDEKIFGKLDAVIAVSLSGRNSMCNTFPELTSKFYSVPNYIQVEEIRQKAKNVPNDLPPFEGVTFITVARMQNISKAIDRAIKVAKRLKSNGLLFRWIMIGDGEDLEAMKDLAKTEQVDDIVLFFGRRDNPYGYMRSADMFVLQSYYEGRPVVVDEAIALKLPVLVSDYASAREQVPKECGIVASNTENGIFSAIKDLLEVPDKLKSWKIKLEQSVSDNTNDASEFIDMLKKVITC